MVLVLVLLHELQQELALPLAGAGLPSLLQRVLRRCGLLQLVARRARRAAAAAAAAAPQQARAALQRRVRAGC